MSKVIPKNTKPSIAIDIKFLPTRVNSKGSLNVSTPICNTKIKVESGL